MTNNSGTNTILHDALASARTETADTFDRFIYTGDLHGSSYFKPFTEKFDNGRTKFWNTGDIFDRGVDSFEIYTTIRELHKEGVFEMTLGNHEVFFIFSWGLHPEADNIVSRLAEQVLTEEQRFSLWDIFYEQFFINQGQQSIASFERGVNFDAGKLKDSINKTVDFLFGNFGLYSEDGIGNLAIHGGLSILPDASVVGETIGGKFVSGLDYVKELDRGLKSLDYNTLLRLAARENKLGHQVWNDMKENGAIVDPNVSANYRWDYPRYFLPTWFDNSVYERGVGKGALTPLQSLRGELDRNGLERVITGHWGVSHPDWANQYSAHGITHYGTSLRLDRSAIRKNGRYGKYGNFGYAIIDVATNSIDEIGDAADLFLEDE